MPFVNIIVYNIFHGLDFIDSEENSTKDQTSIKMCSSLISFSWFTQCNLKNKIQKKK